jgi:hypothetical protein
MTAVGIVGEHTLIYAQGREFGAVGTYTMSRLTLQHSVDPFHPSNQTIVDLDLASTDADGQVIFEQDVIVLKPTDPSRSNGRVLVDIVNRGRPTSTTYVNRDDSPPFPLPEEPPPGDGLLFELGWTVVMAGWQFDIDHHKLLGLRAPKASRGGQQLRGQVSYSAMPAQPLATLSLGLPGHRPFAALPGVDAVLTETDASGLGSGREVSSDDWAFTPDGRGVVRSGGFLPGRNYVVTYSAEGAMVAGCGLLALRDLGPWIRQQIPEASSLVLLGVSQCGRLIRQFLHDGLNVDESGGRVYDAMLPIIAGGRLGHFNQRFANPGVLPVWDSGVSGAATYADLLVSSDESDTAPKIIAINSSTEYWRGDAALIHQDREAGTAHESVRVHHVACTQHSPGVVPQLFSDPFTGVRGATGFGTVDYRPVVRAMLHQLVEWVEDEVEPSEDFVPTGSQLSSRSEVLGHFAAKGWQIPDEQSFGQPVGPVPAVDDEGREIGGIRLPDIVAPLGVHTGWNVRDPDCGAPTFQLMLRGSTVWNDDQPELEPHLEHVRVVAEDLANQRLILGSDVETLVADARVRWLEATRT